MLDIGFWEVALVVLLALIVLGPERLPVVVRQLGRALSRLRRFFNELGQST